VRGQFDCVNEPDEIDLKARQVRRRQQAFRVKVVLQKIGPVGDACGELWSACETRCLATAVVLFGLTSIGKDVVNGSVDTDGVFECRT